MEKYLHDCKCHNKSIRAWVINFWRQGIEFFKKYSVKPLKYLKTCRQEQ